MIHMCHILWNVNLKKKLKFYIKCDDNIININVFNQANQY